MEPYHYVLIVCHKKKPFKQEVLVYDTADDANDVIISEAEKGNNTYLYKIVGRYEQ